MKTSIITPFLVVAIVASTANIGFCQYAGRGYSLATGNETNQRQSQRRSALESRSTSESRHGSGASRLPSSSQNAQGKKSHRQYATPAYGTPGSSQRRGRTQTTSLTRLGGGATARNSKLTARGSNHSSGNGSRLLRQPDHSANKSKSQHQAGKTSSTTLGTWMQKSTNGHRTIQDSRSYRTPASKSNPGLGDTKRNARQVAMASLQKATSKGRITRIGKSKEATSAGNGRSRTETVTLSRWGSQKTSLSKGKRTETPISLHNIQNSRQSAVVRSPGSRGQLIKDVGRLTSRQPVSRERFSQQEEPVAGQFMADDFFGKVSTRKDADTELQDFHPSDVNLSLEDILQNGSAGGLDGRNDAVGGFGGAGTVPEGIGTNAIGGLVKGTGVGYASDDTAEEPSVIDKIIEFFSGDDDDDGATSTDGENGTADPADEGSGAAGNTGTATDAAKTAAGAVKDKPTAKSTPSGRVSGGIVGLLITALTSNTESPDAKENELRGWAAFVGAANGKAPLAGSQSLDEDTASTVRQGNETNQDQTEDQQGLPAHLRDPSEGWGDEVADRKWELKTGGGITDPTDDVAAQYDGPPPSNNQEDLTAQYEGPQVDPSSLPTRVSDNRDWEYQPKE